MMQKIFSLILSLFISLSIFAQDRIFDLSSLFTSGELYPKSLSQWQWIPQSSDYVFVKDNILWKRNVSDKKESEFLTLETLNKAMQARSLADLKRFPQIGKFLSESELYVKIKGGYALYNVDSGKIEHVLSLDPEAEFVQINWEHNRMSYSVGDHLFIRKADSVAVQVDNEFGAKDVRFGHVPHRNEFGITQGSFWSPSGKYLAFYRMDESMVADYPLVDASGRISTVNNVKYPMAGEASHQVTLGVYDTDNGKIVYMQTGEPKDQFLCSVTWTPDEKYILIAVLNRGQNHLKLNQYDSKTGKFVKTLFEESNSRYVEPSDPVYFLQKNPEQFVWLSRRDGWKHFYLYDLSGKMLKQLTSGNWEVIEFSGFDQSGNKLFFTSNKDEITGNHFYFLDMKKGRIHRITKEEGTHMVKPDYNGSAFLDAYNNIHQSTSYVLRLKDGDVKEVLLDNKEHLKDYKLPETRIFSIKNDNGDDLYCRMIMPVGFDSTKKYPVFYYVYGGPHSQLVTNNWLSGGWFLQYMAQKGYIVFTLDNRGTANRGFEFESTIHRRLGMLEVEDQMCGVNYLKNLAYTDKDRFSVDGWSYGGFMTLSLFTRHPDVFCKASCGGPVIDWKFYEVMYGERYMDTPQENPEGYSESSLLNKVDSISGDLLIFHGAQDATVVWQNTLQFVTKCISKGKLIDYFIYPTHEHNVSGPDRVHLWRKIEKFHEYGNVESN